MIISVAAVDVLFAVAPAVVSVVLSDVAPSVVSACVIRCCLSSCWCCVVLFIVVPVVYNSVLFLFFVRTSVVGIIIAATISMTIPILNHTIRFFPRFSLLQQILIG